MEALGSQEIIFWNLQAGIILLPIIMVVLIWLYLRNFKQTISQNIAETNTRLVEIKQLLDENLVFQRKGS